MKSIVLVSALAAVGLLVGSASGRPLEHKRDLITKLVYITEVDAEVVVYVDEAGTPFSTSTSLKVVNVITSAVLPSSTLQVALATSATSVLPSFLIVSESTPQPAPTVVTPSPELPTSKVQSTTSSLTSTSVTSSSSSTPNWVILSSSSTAMLTTLSSSSTPTLITSSSSSTPTSVTPTSSLTPTVIPSSSSAVYSATQDYKPPLQPSSSAEPVPTQSISAGALPLGVTWDVYTGSSECKSEAEIASEFSRMKSFKMVRIYGMDCQQIPLAIQNALKNGQKLMGGAYLDAGGSGEDVSTVIQAYKNAIDQYAGGNWDVIQLFTVENERVNEGRMTAAQVVDAIGKARTQLRQLGYDGPVGAVETAPAMIMNPSICEASDVVMVNIHAFFDPNTEAENAGPFVQGQVKRVQAACNNKRVVVTESGWPRQGSPNGNAIPSADNQRAALQSLRATFTGDMFLFSAFDSAWKITTASTFNAERFWGIIQ